MSVLAHVCRSCAHPMDWHDARNRGYTTCRCCHDGTGDPDPVPTLLPTTSWPSGIREGLWQPGSLRNAGTMHATRTCSCEGCREAAGGLTIREHPVATGRMEGSSSR